MEDKPAVSKSRRSFPSWAWGIVLVIIGVGCSYLSAPDRIPRVYSEAKIRVLNSDTIATNPRSILDESQPMPIIKEPSSGLAHSSSGLDYESEATVAKGLQIVAIALVAWGLFLIFFPLSLRYRLGRYIDSKDL